MTSAVVAPTTAGSGGSRKRLRRYLTMPLVLAAVCVALYLFVANQTLDTIEERALAPARLGAAIWQHVLLAAASTFFTLIIAVPLGVILSRRFTHRFRPYLITILTLGQAVPTIAILVLLAVAFSFIGFEAAVVGLVLYAIVPVLLNTIVGLEQVDGSVLEAGRGMGMSRLTVLGRIELPLAVPVILAGVRTALVINVGTATLATYINAGGLGDVIVAGLSTNRFTVQLVGAVLTAVLALTIDYIAGIAEDILRPRGL